MLNKYYIYKYIYILLWRFHQYKLILFKTWNTTTFALIFSGVVLYFLFMFNHASDSWYLPRSNSCGLRDLANKLEYIRIFRIYEQKKKKKKRRKKWNIVNVAFLAAKFKNIKCISWRTFSSPFCNHKDHIVKLALCLINSP